MKSGVVQIILINQIIQISLKINILSTLVNPFFEKFLERILSRRRGDLL